MKRSQLHLMATPMLMRVVAVIVRVLMAMSSRRMRVLVPVVGVSHAFMRMLVLMLVFGVAAHLLSPPSG
jgi:hypothetical protein